MDKKALIEEIRGFLMKLSISNETIFIGILPEKIIYEICIYYNIDFQEFTSSSTKRIYAEPRQVSAYLLKNYTRKTRAYKDGYTSENHLTLSNIASIIGKKTHASIIHSIKTIENQIESNKTFDKKIKEIENILKNS